MLVVKEMVPVLPARVVDIVALPETGKTGLLLTGTLLPGLEGDGTTETTVVITLIMLEGVGTTEAAEVVVAFAETGGTMIVTVETGTSVVKTLVDCQMAGQLGVPAGH